MKFSKYDWDVDRAYRLMRRREMSNLLADAGLRSERSIASLRTAFENLGKSAGIAGAEFSNWRQWVNDKVSVSSGLDGGIGEGGVFQDPGTTYTFAPFSFSSVNPFMPASRYRTPLSYVLKNRTDWWNRMYPLSSIYDDDV